MTTKAKISTTEQVATQETCIINGMEFVSIANELERYYDIPTGRGGTTVRIKIHDPQWLFVRESGSHMVIASNGYTHYIPANFVHLAWAKRPNTDAAEF